MAERRRTVLSRDAILAGAVRILDEQGERGLTLRGLAAELGTGVASLYWYVESKDDLLRLAGDELVARALNASEIDPAGADPLEEARKLGLALFAELDRHPWSASYLTSDSQHRVGGVMTWELFATCLKNAGLTPRQQFYGVSALLNYVVGVGRQISTTRFDPSGPRLDLGGKSRGEFLGAMADRWRTLDPEAFPTTRELADLLAEHEDADQFVAGLDLLISGLREQARTAAAR